MTSMETAIDRLLASSLLAFLATASIREIIDRLLASNMLYR